MVLACRRQYTTPPTIDLWSGQNAAVQRCPRRSRYAQAIAVFLAQPRSEHGSVPVGLANS